MARIVQFAQCVFAAVSAADVPQLRGRQLASPVDALEDCEVCHHDLYTGYNHEQSGEPSGWQEEEEAIQGVNAWWLCAEKCSRKSGCDGWTFTYKGDGPPYKCDLKSGTKPRSRWTTDYNVISGLPLANATALQLSATPAMNCIPSNAPDRCCNGGPASPIYCDSCCSGICDVTGLVCF